MLKLGKFLDILSPWTRSLGKIPIKSSNYFSKHLVIFVVVC